ncbi:DUF4390 domain-containing protein [Plasticicumulans sp.]|uniref:DUF4390 domain-containing protein n=1 Tax=Plasticicumulans sp. TaxID=2307179 RepID=UPI002B582372|nr:DUF4390 domain-containing protein [Plasticicumulans sp.]MBS0600810.1 DUF4390 domain-containing protein [Pseudomonadota bacterium]HMV40287.1 DUF4390 domain-containing protein [Plasticicumulans sp.]HMW30252.1 DUF4390 domain-containing protein [Plasticicumulans sp.]HMW42116.1 DUF4390 domain-containing protein [Plasticicumulans sp.]HMZ10131.1 DUF4390 domain-containing protein [Plasticicumulans sp.]
MTAFTDRHRTPCLALLLGLLCLWLAPVPAAADGFRVLRASSTSERGLLRLDALIDLQFTEAPLDALRNGVPLTIEIDVEIVRDRDLLWDETVASLSQRFRLEYHALARQYVAVNLNTNDLRSFPTLAGALDAIGRLHDFPLIDRALLKPPGNYYGRLRASLDIEALPPPLRPVAYLSTDWRLGSTWYAWSL